MANSDPAASGWHLDKRVPLALIITIIIQTAGAFWWAATITARVDTIEGQIEAASGRGERLTRVEATQAHISSALQRIEAKLDRLGSP